MKQRLGDFELLEQIDPGGYTIVWKATQHMGHGVTRPAAVKILQQWQATSDEQIGVLRAEVELLLAVGSCPYIVEVYGFGIDDEVGPWIGMELSGKSLKHLITDQPANVDDVRAMLHDSLKAMSVVHRSDPQILHRDIKPNNILRSRYGHFQIADFGLAKRSGVEDTMNFTTVQYAAPELLDSTLGQESPKMDLYSLGMVAYEFALGKQLYRKQFPSIYDPYATRSAETTTMDDKPKWMYWHASAQMTLPKIKDVIPDFPEDLSNCIAKMLAKPVRERMGSADEALGMVGEVSLRDPSRGMQGGLEEIAAPPSKLNPIALAAVALWLLAAVGFGGWYMLSMTAPKPIIGTEQDLFTADKPDILVRGKIQDFPEGGSATVVRKGGATFPLNVDDSGMFSGNVLLPTVTEQDAEVRILDGGGTVVANRIIRLQRTSPKTVKVTFKTNPPVASWDMKIRETGRPNDPYTLTTDQNGNVTFEIAHGPFRIAMDHPRYKEVDTPETTGDDPEKTVTVVMNPLSEARIADKRERLLSEMDSLIDKAAAGDPEAIRRLEQIRKELAELEPMAGDKDAARRVALQQELDEMMKRAMAGDPEAAKRVKEINEELRKLATKGAGGDVPSSDPAAAAAREAKRTALLDEMNSLLDAAARGDPAAIKRLKEINNELAQLEADDMKAGTGNDRRSALVREMMGLADKVAAGDPEAVARLREIRTELNQIAEAEAAKRAGKPMASIYQRREALIRELGEVIERTNGGDVSGYVRMREIHTGLNLLEKEDTSIGAIPNRRRELLTELNPAIDLARAGNAESKLRLPEIQRELATLSAIESAQGDAGELAAAAMRMNAGDPGLDLIDRGTLLGLTSLQFKAFLEVNIPTGCLKVELVPHITKLRLSGPVFNEQEYDRLLARLTPALPRLQLEVRVDAWAVCRRFEDSLIKLGATDVRVHAHVNYSDASMFIQFKKTGKFTKDEVFVLARPFVLDRDMLRIQPL